MVQAQRDTARDALKADASHGKAAAAAQQAALARVRHMDTQLTARVAELDGVRGELSARSKEADDWRTKGVALSVQLEASERALEASQGRGKVLENQLGHKESEIANLQRQLAVLHDCRCELCGIP